VLDDQQDLAQGINHKEKLSIPEFISIGLMDFPPVDLGQEAPLLLLSTLGLLAGLITTLAGLGGGLMLVLSLALLHDPHTALVVTAPALLLGNLHRLTLFRGHLSLDVAGRLAVGALPGAFLGGLVAVGLPPQVLKALMSGMVLLLWVRRFLPNGGRLPRWVLTPAGAGIGALTAASGGAGILVTPLILASGVTGDAFIATAATSAVAMHFGRLAAYGSGGLVDGQSLAWAAVLGGAIPFGNLLGRRIRRQISEAAAMRCTYVALAGCVGLALVGVA
jgi:uncharacterized membrane protein YfcA